MHLLGLIENFLFSASGSLALFIDWKKEKPLEIDETN